MLPASPKPSLVLLLAASLLGGCDEDEGPTGLDTFISATLSGRDGSVDFTGAATLTEDTTLGRFTCRATNDAGYSVTISWTSGVAAVDTPIQLSQDVFVKTGAPGNPGVLVDDFFMGELRFSAVGEEYEGTFKAGPKVEGEERSIVEVSSGSFLCAVQEGAETGG